MLADERSICRDRHTADSHAELVQRALERGRHVLVEKPLALNDEELDKVNRSGYPVEWVNLMVGF